MQRWQQTQTNETQQHSQENRDSYDVAPSVLLNMFKLGIAIIACACNSVNMAGRGLKTHSRVMQYSGPMWDDEQKESRVICRNTDMGQTLFIGVRDNMHIFHLASRRGANVTQGRWHASRHGQNSLRIIKRVHLKQRKISTSLIDWISTGAWQAVSGNSKQGWIN